MAKSIAFAADVSRLECVARSPSNRLLVSAEESDRLPQLFLECTLSHGARVIVRPSIGRGAGILAAALAFAAGGCGGVAKGHAPSSSGGSGQSGSGVADSGGSAGRGSDLSDGGTNTISDEPMPCKTRDGADGILVDSFPQPPIELVCQPFDQPGALDDRCPSGPVVICSFDDCLGQGTLAGCCRADGSCGLWDNGAFAPGKSLGCIDRSEWVKNASWLHGEGAVSCTPK